MQSKNANRFIKAIIIQFSLIFLFSLIYYSIINDFKSVIDHPVIEYRDCLLLSTTIQGCIGITNILPQTQLSKSLTITQQILSIMSSLYIVFTFTL